MFSLSKLPYQPAKYTFVLQIESMIVTLCYLIVDQICMKNNHKLHILGQVDIGSSNFLETFKYMVWTLAWINTDIHCLFTSISTSTTIKILLFREVNTKYVAQLWSWTWPS